MHCHQIITLPNLKVLSSSGISVNKRGMLLEEKALESLVSMTSQASTEGIDLTVVSDYRTWQHQKKLYTDYINKYGEQARDFSAEPGHSQHQLGTVVDFRTLSIKFADTKASNWLLEYGGKYGWSLSYPKGYKEITGYSWESWHWRWIGRAAVRMQDEFFEGSQQLLLEFWHENSPALDSDMRANYSGI